MSRTAWALIAAILVAGCAGSDAASPNDTAAGPEVRDVGLPGPDLGGPDGLVEDAGPPKPVDVALPRDGVPDLPEAQDTAADVPAAEDLAPDLVLPDPDVPEATDVATADAVDTVEPPRPFTIVVLPDTQYASEWPNGDANPYFRMTRWIAEHAAEQNIRFVLHMGDITDDNHPSEWAVADRAHGVLDDAGIPYSVVPGNHDYPSGSGSGLSRDTTLYNEHFGPWRFEGRPWYGGHRGEGNDDNVALFEAGGMSFLAISLAFAPSKDALCWASEQIAAHPDRRVILVTHCYQKNGGGHATNCGTNYDIAGSGGDTTWAELAARHENVFLVLSGHITDSEHRIRTGNAGNPVHEILTDYQQEAPCSSTPCGGLCNGAGRLGNGWLRTLTFYPDEDRVEVRSLTAEEGQVLYFPDGVPAFICGAYDADPLHADHSFSFDYDMTGAWPPPRYDDRGSVAFNDRTVNEDPSGDQLAPALAADPSGAFVVAWEHDPDNDGRFQIVARGFAPGGCARFGDLVVGGSHDGQQQAPAVAADATGGFVVVWQDDPDDDGVYDVIARGFHADGTERFASIVANTDAAGQQAAPALAVAPDGAFVVAWEDDRDGNGFYQIYARGFHADGTERFARVVVNSVDDGQQRSPAVVSDAAGGFVVVWEDDQDRDGAYQVYARGFEADGTERFVDTPMLGADTGHQVASAIAMDASGGFVVAWEDDGDGNGLYQAFARGFEADGTQRFAATVVNTEDDGQQRTPSVAMDATGAFVVAWADDQDDNGYFQIYARAFHADGTERVADFVVNTDGTGQQIHPAAALGPTGAWVFAWQDDMDGNGFFEILARGLDPPDRD